MSADLGRGDRSALTRLYDLTAPRLLRYAETLTRNRADAEDALQSALVKVARKPKQLAKADKPWAYLVRMVRNEALKVIGRRRPISSLASLLQAWRPVECPLEQQESREKVQQAVAKLPAEQAEVVVLKIWEQFTFAEIAELISESPNTAASRYRYALEKLSRHLQPLVDSARADMDAPSESLNDSIGQLPLEKIVSSASLKSSKEVPNV
ncbi:MAG: sigma-70 family RNA polymerase sigma factor [Planctomycetota bacterium]|nr:sigma-70 family RNA polymerase sigma factor [Planctomycetota bacterium]MDA1163265.1 sigma-70 family RNA polymerase sigma factor [Planctomycetota bacterium]